jgi:hypothetical protein
VSSEKHETAAEAGAEEGGGDAAGVVPVTVVVGSYCYRLTFLPPITRLANSAKPWRLITCGRLYSCDALPRMVSTLSLCLVPPGRQMAATTAGRRSTPTCTPQVGWSGAGGCQDT